jgi:signal transduction histidine kinase
VPEFRAAGAGVVMGVTARLFVLVLIAILPALAIQTYGEFDLRRTRETEVRQNAMQLARFASGELDGIAESARALVTAFARVSAVRAVDAAACTDYARALNAGFPQYAAIGATALDGTVFCASRTFGGVNAADRPWFQRTLASNAFTVGEYTIARTAHVPVLQFAVPIEDVAGHTNGVAYLLLDLGWLAGRFGQKPMDRTATLSIADRTGTVLVRLPDNAQFAGTRFADMYMPYVEAAAPGTADIIGLDGVARVLGYVPAKASASGLYTGIGLTKEDAFASVERAADRGFAMIALGLALGLLAAWIGGRRFISRPIGQLSRAAARWAAGDFDARSGAMPDRSEIGRLGATFDAMAAGLARRDAERDRAEARLREIAGALEREATARSEAAEALQRLNETLEQRVADETAARVVAEEALRQAQKMEALGQLTGGVAHDFNNLLQAIMGNLELLQVQADTAGGAVPAGVVRQSAEAALRGARRGAAITDRLLAFSRQQPLAPVAIDVNHLIAGLSDMIHRTLGESITSETVLGAGLWRAFADPNQLESALVNLAVNARDAMPTGGKLTIEAANCHLDEVYAAAHAEVAPGQYVQISVSDTGVGMPDAVVARAFDPFFTTKGPGQGTGLGLSQVYGFAKQSNGHVKIYSAPGQGTSVKLYLPRAQAAAAPSAVAPRGAAPRPGRHAGKRVVVVEDDPDVRANAVAMLTKLGFVVEAAADGATALRLLESRSDADLLFTDVGLPAPWNGRALAEAAQRLRPDLRVLYTSGYARNAIVHSGRLDAGVQLLTKPYSFSDLAAKVIGILED